MWAKPNAILFSGNKISNSNEFRVIGHNWEMKSHDNIKFMQNHIVLKYKIDGFR